MIDTDKMRMALAATPLCQAAWTMKDGNNPTMLCAVSALVSFAGVQPDLIHRMNEALGGSEFFESFAAPVLEAEYGIPYRIASHIPGIFDKQENEWRGVTEVLDMCERFNMDVLHDEAIYEDRFRFPQHTCATPPLMGTGGVVTFTIDGNIGDYTIIDWVQPSTASYASICEEMVTTEVALATPPQKNAPWLGKKNKHAFKALGY